MGDESWGFPSRDCSRTTAGSLFAAYRFSSKLNLEEDLRALRVRTATSETIDIKIQQTFSLFLFKIFLCKCRELFFCVQLDVEFSFLLGSIKPEKSGMRVMLRLYKEIFTMRADQCAGQFPLRSFEKPAKRVVHRHSRRFAFSRTRLDFHL